MLCGRFIEFVSQVYGWIVYKINKLAPKWEKKPFPFCLNHGQFLVILKGDFWISCSPSACSVLLFPPLYKQKQQSYQFLYKGRLKRHVSAFQSGLRTCTHGKMKSLVNSLCFVCTWLSLGLPAVLVFKLASVFLGLNTRRNGLGK